MPDKFSATWVSHSSMSDFLACPKAYYLKNVFRHPKTNKKVKLMTPPMALGIAVHSVLESLSSLRKEDRLREPLMKKFEDAWEKVSGKQGGFFDIDSEHRYKERGRAMIRRVMDNPGPILLPAVKMKEDLPWFWLSPEEEIILCGKIDWLEYLPDKDAVRIIDFKTGRNEESGESLQLPIYLLLVKNCQGRPVEKASYWYLESGDAPVEKILPDPEKAMADVLKVARQVKLARRLAKYDCPSGSLGCHACRPFQAIVNGEAELVGEDDYGTGVYILPRPAEFNKDSEIL